MTDIVHSIYAYDGDNGFKFRAGEKILVKERGENGWWRGTLLNQGDSTNGEIEEKEGWFPSSYVEGAGNININTQVSGVSPHPASPPKSPDHLLPPNWKSTTAPNGKTYYYNQVTQETTWDFPTEAKTTPTKSPPATYPKRHTIAQSSDIKKPSPKIITNDNNPISPKANETISPRCNSSASIRTADSGYSSSIGSPSPTPSKDSLDAKSVGSTGSGGGIRKRGKTMTLNLTPSRPPFLTYPSIDESKEQSLLNQLEVSFCDNFWDDLGENTGFDIVQNYIQRGKNNCREMADFFRERAVIEDAYSKSLLKLAHSLHGNKEKSTCGEAWQKLKKSVEQEAVNHHDFSSALVDGLDRTLTEYGQRPVFTERKDSKRIDVVIQEDRKRVMQKFKDVEKQQNALTDRQTKIGLLSKPQEIAKAQKKINAAADELKRSIDDYNDVQRKLVEDMILGLMELEKMEKERIQFVQKKLSMYTELAKSVLDKNSEALTKTENEVEKIDPALDRKAFVDGSRTGSIRPVDMKK